MMVPKKYLKKLQQIASDHPEAYSVQYVESIPGGVGYAPYAQVTYYSDEPGAAARREYISLS